MFDLIAFGGNPMEWAIVALVVLVLFGGSKIPEMMKGLGSGVKEFKKGIKDEDEETRTTPAGPSEAAKKDPAA
jgi:sec-independent protein translocase protein TatA